MAIIKLMDFALKFCWSISKNIASATFNNFILFNLLTPPPIKGLVKRLLKDKVIKGSAGYIFGDTPAKLQSKVHQLYNGHCIIEDGETSNVILDT